jgi:hypothetical protein
MIIDKLVLEKKLSELLKPKLKSVLNYPPPTSHRLNIIRSIEELDNSFTKTMDSFLRNEIKNYTEKCFRELLKVDKDSIKYSSLGLLHQKSMTS